MRQNQGVVRELHSPTKFRRASYLGSWWRGVPPVTSFHCKHCVGISLSGTRL